MRDVCLLRILPNAIERPARIALSISGRGRCRIEMIATERGQNARSP
jgi:hypothetical protein